MHKAPKICDLRGFALLDGKNDYFEMPSCLAWYSMICFRVS